MVITRLASIALSMTGLSTESARFQARSAFTGTGFTTRESEKVVSHPVRRRIIMLLMIMRSAGLMTIIISLILSFVGNSGDVSKMMRLLWLIVGVGLMWFLVNLAAFNKYFTRIMSKALKKWTDLDVKDYASLLNLAGDYTVMELQVKKNDWLESKKLRDCNLRQEGVTVLGINRSDGSYVGVPKPDTEFYEGDVLILYGRGDSIRNIDKREAGARGDMEHETARGTQQSYLAEQDRQEQQFKSSREHKEKSEDNDKNKENNAKEKK